MRKLSYWAKINPWKSRVLIILSHILLIFLGWYTGEGLAGLGIQMPAYWLYLFLVIFIIAAITYPLKKNKVFTGRRLFYLQQKTRDFLLAAATFCMIVSLTNEKENTFYVSQPAFAIPAASALVIKEKPTATEILASLKYRDKSTLTRMEKRVLKQEFKKQLKNYVVAKIKGNKKESGNAGLIILAIIGAIGLLSLVAALSCNLSCNGSDGAALAVLILGTAGIIWGLLAVIKAVKRGSGEKKKEGKREGNKVAFFKKQE
jgi:hypothetical protein